MDFKDSTLECFMKQINLRIDEIENRLSRTQQELSSRDYHMARYMYGKDCKSY